MPEGEELKDVKEQDEKSTNGQVGRKRRSVKLEVSCDIPLENNIGRLSLSSS